MEDIIGTDGKIIQFSYERFKRDVLEGQCCFICGSSETGTKEHILPKWILKKYDLFDRGIILPNLTDFKYGTYVIPCCDSCNKEMGKVFENPISELVACGLTAVKGQIAKDGGRLFMHWLALIFFKTHLKDTHLQRHRDTRIGNEKIGDNYYWPPFYYIHSFIRTFYSGVTVDSRNYGSLFVFSAKGDEKSFDFGDLAMYDGLGILMRLDKVCFIYLLNDCGIIRTYFERVGTVAWERPELSYGQLREFFIHVVKNNFLLKLRPRFGIKENELTSAIPNAISFHNEISEIEIFKVLCDRVFYNDLKNGWLPPEVYKDFRDGKYSFLYDGE